MSNDPSIADDHPAHIAGEHQQPRVTAPVAEASARIARLGDAPAIGVVQAAVWRSSYREVLPPEVVEQFEASSFARVWRDSLKNPPSPRHVLLVACAGEQVVGFAAVGPSIDKDAEQSSGEVLALGVHPDARRIGHGSRLLNAAVDTLRGKGFVSMSVWLLAGDQDTRAFMTAAGLSPDGAYRDRVINVDRAVAREVRLSADLGGE